MTYIIMMGSLVLFFVFILRFLGGLSTNNHSTLPSPLHTTNPSLESTQVVYIFRVLDSISHTPIRHAKVELFRPGITIEPLFSDDNGVASFSFSIRESEQAKIVFFAKGYKLYESNVTITNDKKPAQEVLLEQDKSSK